MDKTKKQLGSFVSRKTQLFSFLSAEKECFNWCFCDGILAELKDDFIGIVERFHWFC